MTNERIVIRRIINGIKSEFILDPGFFGSVRLTDESQVLDFEIMKRLCRVSLEHYGLIKVPDIDYFIQFKVDRLNRFIRFMAPRIMTNETNKPLFCKRFNFKEEELPAVEVKVGSQVPLDGMKYFQCSLNSKSYTYKVDIKRSESISELRSENGKFLTRLIRDSEMIKNSTFENFRVNSTLKIINCLPKDVNIQFLINNAVKSTKELAAQQSH